MSPPPPLRLLLDQGVPRDAVSLLRERGIDCRHVGEMGQQRASDTQILEVARESDAIVVTLDADFHMLLAVSGESRPSVIRIRIEGLAAARLAGLVLRVVEQWTPELMAGAAVTVKSNKTTCHRLPIGGVPVT